MKLICKIICAPIVALLTVTVWMCSIFLYCSSFILGLVSTVVALLAVFVMITTSITNGLILLAVAFLISPKGLPVLAVLIVGQVQKLRFTIQDAVYG